MQIFEVNQKTCPSRAGISVFAGHVYDAVTECPCSVAALIHMSLRVAVTLLNPAGDAARVKRLNAQSSENDVALFLTNHSLSFACSPSTFQILQISRVSERSLSCCRIGCSVFHARSCCPFSTLFPGKSMLFPPSSACFSHAITCFLRCKSMLLHRFTQCVGAGSAISVRCRGCDPPHLPVYFS